MKFVFLIYFVLTLFVATIVLASNPKKAISVNKDISAHKSGRITNPAPQRPNVCRKEKTKSKKKKYLKIERIKQQ